METVLEGKCPRCGYRCLGWALVNPVYQACPRCHGGLEITQDGRFYAHGFSPFTAEKIGPNRN